MTDSNIQEQLRRNYEKKRQEICKFHTGEEFAKNKEEHRMKRQAEKDPDEDVERFECGFAERIRSIRETISGLARSTGLAGEIAQLKQSVLETGDSLNSSIHFLSPYTIMQSQNALNSAYEEISKAHAELAPRKPFSFSKKNHSKKENDEVKPETAVERFEVKLEGVEGVSDELIEKTDEELCAYNCYQLKNLKNCEVYLTGRLKALHMLRLINCRVFVGPVSGAAHITECEDCHINIACHQLRIHNTYRSSFYVHVATGPIVENVHSVCFAPYAFEYPNISSHMDFCNLGGVNEWERVKDFKWLRKDHSPNWSVIPLENRIGTTRK